VRNFAEIASSYQRFAEAEAHGRSPLYEHLALEIAGDESTLEFLSAFSRSKQQPEPAVRGCTIRVRHAEGLGTFPYIAARKSEDNTRSDDETPHANE
jgi:hypothetical protein